MNDSDNDFLSSPSPEPPKHAADEMIDIDILTPRIGLDLDSSDIIDAKMKPIAKKKKKKKKKPDVVKDRDLLDSSIMDESSADF